MKILTFALTIAACLFSTAAHASFTSYVIREGGGNPPTIQTNNDYVAGATEFIISEGGMKAGWGSDNLNGFTIGQIASVSVTRHDDVTRFAAGSGPAVAPYLNIWVTDGLGNYAVIANEPSDANFQPLFVDNGDGSKTYNLSYADLSDKVAKVYETPGAGSNSSWVHAFAGSGDPLTFADVAGLAIEAPSAAYITDPTNAVGGGAPRELGTNDAYGINWVFGDTLTNYVSGAEGYVVSNPGAVPIPEPTSLALLGMSSLALLFRRNRR